MLLLGGVIVGLGMAAFSALNNGKTENTSLPPGAIARVNEAIILRADFARALTSVSAGKQNPLTKNDEAAILQRLIEEELLVQRALDMQLVQQDPALRNALVDAITKDIIARSRAMPISQVVLRDYYFRNKGRFARPARIFVRAVFIPKSEAFSQKAEFDLAMANGTKPQDLIARFAKNTPTVPEGLIPEQKLKDYVGASPIEILNTLARGQWSDWIEVKAGVWRFYMVNRTRARTPELDTIRETVEAAYLDERDDAALRTYLDRLKRNITITYGPDAPE